MLEKSTSKGLRQELQSVQVRGGGGGGGEGGEHTGEGGGGRRRGFSWKAGPMLCLSLHFVFF